MRIILKIGYFILLFVLILMLYLEYHNYKILNYEIDTNNYIDQIEKLKNNIEIIDNYNIADYELMTTINRCRNIIKYKEILEQEFIDIADIYYINQNSAGGRCNGMDYDYESAYLHQYLNLYNDQNIKETFEQVLTNEVNITSAFIEMVEESYNEQV